MSGKRTAYAVSCGEYGDWRCFGIFEKRETAERFRHQLVEAADEKPHPDWFYVETFDYFEGDTLPLSADPYAESSYRWGVAAGV